MYGGLYGGRILLSGYCIYTRINRVLIVRMYVCRHYYASKFLKLTNLVIFSRDIDYNRRTDAFRDFISLIINQFNPRLPPAAQRKQAKRLYIYIYIYSPLPKTGVRRDQVLGSPPIFERLDVLHQVSIVRDKNKAF